MPLESCMILLDNSEFMRNGDYVPTRMEAQNDAANMIVSQKTQSNPESTVGVISMSSRSSSNHAELLVSPTDDMGKILNALHGVPLCGGTGGSISKGSKDAVDIAASVQVAALALKHRRNKNGSQRIVLFIGSPLNTVEIRALVRAGKQLKKNNVAIDVVALGELDVNESKLRELVDAANGSSASSGGDGEAPERTCHLVTIPAGVLPSDVLVTSPILRGDGGGGGGGGGAGGAASGGGGGGDGFGDFGGVDANMDPELAMALRVSMEEERARQERAAAAQATAAAESSEGKEEEKGDAAAGGDAAADAADEEMNDEDALLQQALAMSMAEGVGGESGSAAAEGTSTAAGEKMDTGGDDEDEDEAIQMALQMSMQADDGNAEDAKGDGAAAAGASASGQFQDPQFVNQLLGSLPGVDPNDPAIQAALKSASGGEKEKEGDKKEDGAGEKKE